MRPWRSSSDELTAGGIFLAYGQALGAFAAFGEGVDGRLYGGERAAVRAGGVGPGGVGGAMYALARTCRPRSVVRDPFFQGR